MEGKDIPDMADIEGSVKPDEDPDGAEVARPAPEGIPWLDDGGEL